MGRQQQQTIADEKKAKYMIDNFGCSFLLKGNATYCVKKELVDGGMEYECSGFEECN